jgi:hypothetical protein
VLKGLTAEFGYRNGYFLPEESNETLIIRSKLLYTYGDFCRQGATPMETKAELSKTELANRTTSLSKQSRSEVRKK